jgi:hypothetical protein
MLEVQLRSRVYDRVVPSAQLRILAQCGVFSANVGLFCNDESYCKRFDIADASYIIERDQYGSDYCS